jgi:hypothetical protein
MMKALLVKQTINAALAKEKQGDKKRALRLYLRCPDDAFAQESVRKLSPLQFSSPAIFRHSKILSRDEKIVLDEILKIQNQKIRLTQKLLIERTEIPAKRITSLMESLQDKGYISKLPFRYRYTQVLENDKKVSEADKADKADKQTLMQPKKKPT